MQTGLVVWMTEDQPQAIVFFGWKFSILEE
jgi:hypothetical protein